MKRQTRIQNHARVTFDSDPIREDLERHSLSGSAIVIGTQIGKSLLYLTSTIVLARVLSPEDFGLFAIVTAFTNFLLLFKDFGLSAATIQHKEIDRAQVSVLFWINVASGALLMSIVVLLAPVVAALYVDPRLYAVTLALSINFLLGSFTVQHQALLKRQMRFLALAITELLPLALGIVAAIIAAFQGFKYWALITMSLTTSASAVPITWIVCHWRPMLRPANTSVKQMIRFGGYLTGANIINYLSRNADNVLIGWYWGAHQLGFYDRAYQLMFFPIYQINTPLSFVAIPLLSRLRETPERYEEAYIKLLRLTSILTMPLITFLLVTADWTINLLLGPQWDETSRIFRCFGLTALIQTVTNTTGWLFISQGRTRELMRWNIVSGMISLLSIISGLPWGPSGVAISLSASMLFANLPLLLYFLKRALIIEPKIIFKALEAVIASIICLFLALVSIKSAIGTENTFINLALSAFVTFTGTVVLLLCMKITGKFP